MTESMDVGQFNGSENVVNARPPRQHSVRARALFVCLLVRNCAKRNQLFWPVKIASKKMLPFIILLATSRLHHDWSCIFVYVHCCSITVPMSREFGINILDAQVLLLLFNIIAGKILRFAKSVVCMCFFFLKIPEIPEAIQNEVFCCYPRW